MEARPGDAGLPPDATRLLHSARVARAGRDRWRSVGTTLRALHAMGVTLAQIEAQTGIPPATAWRKISSAHRSRMTRSTRSTANW